MSNRDQSSTRMHSSRMRTARSSSRQSGRGLPQCMLGYTNPLPGCGPRDPPGMGLETSPPRVWAWRPPPPVGVWRTPWRLARHAGISPARHAGISPARHAGIPPPLSTEFLTHVTENITLSQTSFAGGKNGLERRFK